MSQSDQQTRSGHSARHWGGHTVGHRGRPRATLTTTRGAHSSRRHRQLHRKALRGSRPSRQSLIGRQRARTSPLSRSFGSKAISRRASSDASKTLNALGALAGAATEAPDPTTKSVRRSFVRNDAASSGVKNCSVTVRNSINLRGRLPARYHMQLGQLSAGDAMMAK